MKTKKGRYFYIFHLNVSSWATPVITLHLTYMLYTPPQVPRVLWIGKRRQVGFKTVQNNMAKNDLFPGSLTWLANGTTDASPQIFTVVGESGVSGQLLSASRLVTKLPTLTGTL